MRAGAVRLNKMRAGFFCVLLGFTILLAARADAARFRTLDKVTAQTHDIEIILNQPIRLGALTITMRVCYETPPEEPPETISFLEVDEQQSDGKIRRLFTGWMFASSPGLNAIEHPVYDLWPLACGKVLQK